MSDYQPLHISRTYDATPQAVWDAWTQPEQLKQWYMPAPYSVPACELDVRPGGQLKIDTQGPDGVIMPVVGEYKEVDEPVKLVMTSSPLDSGGNKLFEVQHTLELSEAGGRTLLKVTSEVLSHGPDADPYLSGMEPGLNQALDQLADVVSGIN